MDSSTGMRVDDSDHGLVAVHLDTRGDETTTDVLTRQTDGELEGPAAAVNPSVGAAPLAVMAVLPDTTVATTPRLLDKFDSLTSDWNFASSETPKLMNKLGDLQRQWSMDSESTGKKISVKRQHPSSPGGASSLSIESTMGRSTLSSYETCLAHVCKADAQQATFERLYQNAKPYVAPPKNPDESSAVSVCSPLTGRNSLEKRLSYIAPGEVRRVRQQQRLEASIHATPMPKAKSVFERLHKNEPRTESLLAGTPKYQSTPRPLQRQPSATKSVHEFSPRRPMERFSSASTVSAHRPMAATLKVLRDTNVVKSEQRRLVYLSPTSSRKSVTHRTTSSVSSVATDSVFERLHRREPRPSLVKPTKTSGAIAKQTADSKSLTSSPPRRKIVKPVATSSTVSPIGNPLTSQSSRGAKGSTVAAHRRQVSLPATTNPERPNVKASIQRSPQQQQGHMGTDQEYSGHDSLALMASFPAPPLSHVHVPVRATKDSRHDSARVIQRFWRTVRNMRRFRVLLSAVVGLQSIWRVHKNVCRAEQEQVSTIQSQSLADERAVESQSLTEQGAAPTEALALISRVDCDSIMPTVVMKIQQWWRLIASKRRRGHAAQLIQRAFRRFVRWYSFLYCSGAAERIQCAYRKFLSRRRREHILQQSLTEQEAAPTEALALVPRVDCDSILPTVVMKIQQWWRLIASNRRRGRAAQLIQRAFRRFVRWYSFLYCSGAAERIQCAYREFLSRRRREHILQCASSTIQRYWMSRRHQTLELRELFAVNLQQHWKRYRARRVIQIRDEKLYSSATLIQSKWRATDKRLRCRNAVVTLQRFARRLLLQREAKLETSLPFAAFGVDRYALGVTSEASNVGLPSPFEIDFRAAVTIQNQYAEWKRKRFKRMLRTLESATGLLHRSLYGSLSRTVTFYAVLQVNATVRSCRAASFTKILESCSTWHLKWNACKQEANVLVVVLLQSFARGCLCRMSLVGRTALPKRMFQMKAASKENVFRTATTYRRTSSVTNRDDERQRSLLNPTTYKSAALVESRVAQYLVGPQDEFSIGGTIESPCLLRVVAQTREGARAAKLPNPS